MEPSDNRDTTTWCGGLPIAGERTLTQAERADIQGRIARSGLAALGGLVVIQGTLLLFLFPRLAFAGLPSVAAPWELFSLIILLISLVAILPKMIRHYRWYQGLWLDLDQNKVLCFRGRLDHFSQEQDPTVAALIRRRLLRTDSESEQSLEVLANAHLAWTANGVAVRQWVPAHPITVADVPAHARVAAEWLEPIAPQQPDAPHVGQRELSRPERNEVRHLRERFLRPAVIHSAFAIWMLYSAFSLLGRTRGHFDTFDVTFLGVAGFFAFRSGSNALLCIRMARQLAHDLQFGRVIITRTPSSESESGTPGVHLSAPEEFLPISGRPWSRNGAPSPWRYLGPG